MLPEVVAKVSNGKRNHGLLLVTSQPWFATDIDLPSR